MGQATISFLGVCTIFRDLPSLQPPSDLPPGLRIPRNRVVLARTTPEFLKDHPRVVPHIARLQLVAEKVTFDPPEGPPNPDPNAPYTYTLDAVRLRVRNATGASSPLGGNLSCLPGLQANLREGNLGGPAESVYVETPGSVQAWFDLKNGEATAYVMKTEQNCNPLTQVPCITVVKIATENGPDDPVVLEYVPFGSDTSITINLFGNAPHVVVMNFADGKAFVDDNHDFLLNYQLAYKVPADGAVNIPKENVCTTPSPGTYTVFPADRCGDAGPGCSTTPFP